MLGSAKPQDSVPVNVPPVGPGVSVRTVPFMVQRPVLFVPLASTARYVSNDAAGCALATNPGRFICTGRLDAVPVAERNGIYTQVIGPTWATVQVPMAGVFTPAPVTVPINVIVGIDSDAMVEVLTFSDVTVRFDIVAVLTFSDAMVAVVTRRAAIVAVPVTVRLTKLVPRAARLVTAVTAAANAWLFGLRFGSNENPAVANAVPNEVGELFPTARA
jgi:hypothetical protein